MEITVVKGSISYINDCEDALVNSELGKRYFSEKGSAQKSLEEGFSRGEIYIALDNDNNCNGFVGYIKWDFSFISLYTYYCREKGKSWSGNRKNTIKVC